MENGEIHYNRYEATPYKALDIFSENYKFKKTDKVVDFGCRGEEGLLFTYIIAFIYL